MSDTTLCGMTDPSHVHAFMAGFEEGVKRNTEHGRCRTRLRGFLNQGRMRHILNLEERRAVHALLHDDDIALQAAIVCDEHASRAGLPFLDWLASLPWAEILKVILTVVIPLLAKPAVSPYGVPEEPKSQ